MLFYNKFNISLSKNISDIQKNIFLLGNFIFRSFKKKEREKLLLD